MKLTPNSMALYNVLKESWSFCVPHHLSPPKAQVPRARQETLKFELPNLRYSIVEIIT